MEPVAALLPTLPWSTLEIIMNIVAGLGAILLTYGIFLQEEKWQDAIFAVGSACLLVYALWIGNIIFSIAMAGFFVASAIELVELMLGRLQHTDERKKDMQKP